MAAVIVVWSCVSCSYMKEHTKVVMCTSFHTFFTFWTILVKCWLDLLYYCKGSESPESIPTIPFLASSIENLFVGLANIKKASPVILNKTNRQVRFLCLVCSSCKENEQTYSWTVCMCIGLLLLASDRHHLWLLHLYRVLWNSKIIFLFLTAKISRHISLLQIIKSDVIEEQFIALYCTLPG